MNNVKAEVKGTTLIITVDLSKPGEPSKSGKTDIVASTGGFAATGVNGVAFSLNVCARRI